MSDNKPMVDTSWELKWRRTLRKKLLNCLVLIENQGKPTQDLMYELRKAKEALTYWNSDTALWEKVSESWLSFFVYTIKGGGKY